MTRTAPRVRADAPRRPGRLIGAMLLASAVAAGAILLGGSLSGVTYASWVAQGEVRPGTITIGDATLTSTAAFSPAAWSNLLPGESVRQPFTVHNGGTVALSLSVSATTSSGDYELRAAPGACGATPLTGATITTTPASLGVLAAGASATECLEVRLSAGAQPGTSTSIIATVTGGQVHG